jgi:hypothetical protein
MARNAPEMQHIPAPDFHFGFRLGLSLSQAFNHRFAAVQFFLCELTISPPGSGTVIATVCAFRYNSSSQLGTGVRN